MSDDTIYTQIESTYSEGYYDEGYEDDPYSSGYWPGTGDIVTEVAGDLADRVRARVGSEDGVVTITEAHWNSGYCITCSYEEVDFFVSVNGAEVYRAPKWESDSPGRPEDFSAFAKFNEWLNGTDDVTSPDLI